MCFPGLDYSKGHLLPSMYLPLCEGSSCPKQMGLDLYSPLPNLHPYGFLNSTYPSNLDNLFLSTYWFCSHGPLFLEETSPPPPLKSVSFWFSTRGNTTRYLVWLSLCGSLGLSVYTIQQTPWSSLPSHAQSSVQPDLGVQDGYLNSRASHYHCWTWLLIPYLSNCRDLNTHGESLWPNQRKT